jgi:hypothetical protein
LIARGNTAFYNLPSGLYSHPFMNARFLLTILVAATGLTACSTTDDAEYYHKLKNKNERYEEKIDRRKARIQARQERTDMWFDSLMD